jgi:hypothetical protein
VEFAQQRNDLRAGAAVEVAGRLVGQQHGRVADDGPGEGDALTLPPGQLVGAVAEPKAEADACQCQLRALAPLTQRHVRIQQAIGDAVQGRLAGRQEELLEDEADPEHPQRRELPVGQLRKVLLARLHGLP